MEHWMIYVGIGWVLMGLLFCRMVCNTNYNDGNKWDEGDTLLVICGFVLPPVLLLAGLAAEGKNCFRRSKTQIYWNEKESQIMTKAGKCLYDKNYDKQVIETGTATRLALGERIKKLEQINRDYDYQDEKIDADNAAIDKRNKENDAEYEQDKKEIATLKAQLQCSAKTNGKHKMEFREKNILFTFRCRICSLEIDRTKAELSPSEREALKRLKVL